jgi:uncharacterized protein (TIGR02246 family)
MRTVLRIATTVSLAVVPALMLMGCQPAAEPEAAATPAPTDEELLQQLAADFEAAWGQADAAAIAAFGTEDGDILNERGHHQGRAAVEETYRDGFETIYKGTSIDIEITSVRFLQPDVAVADGTYEVTGATVPEGEEAPTLKGLWMNVNVKVDEKWYISCSRPMVPVEAPGDDPETTS